MNFNNDLFISCADAVVDWENPFREHLVKIPWLVSDEDWNVFLAIDVGKLTWDMNKPMPVIWNSKRG